MPVATIHASRSNPLKKIFLYGLILAGAGALVYFGGNSLRKINFLQGRAELTVNVLQGQADVMLNGESIGTTPIQNHQARTGTNTLKIKNSLNQYELTLDFLANSEIVINQDLGVSQTFSSGQNFWMEKETSGTVMSVISEPVSAKVFIDNTEVGQTPYSTNELTEGEYDLRVETTGFESQTARVKVRKGYKLNVSTKLYPLPVPARVDLFEGSDKLYDLTTDNKLVNADVQAWIKAILYWNQSRGINIAGTGQNKEKVFDFFLDYDGNLYDTQGAPVTEVAEFKEFSDIKRGAYLGRASDGKGITKEARAVIETFDNITVSISGTAKIKDTGVGWLRVRDAASTAGKEIARVNVGESYKVLEEKTGWVKIKVSDKTEGWVSAEFVTITR